MKRNLIILLICLFLIPIGVKAAPYDSYNTMNLEEALKDEDIDKAFSSYKESDKKINIYLFRGKGCSYCRAFLTYLNSITDEYGKYFNLVSFETWHDDKNKTLLDNVSSYLNKKATGVPYIVIGKEIFPGYTSSYDSDIKDAIKSLYNEKASKRYDVFDEMVKNNVSFTKVDTTTAKDDTTTTTGDNANYSNTANTEASDEVKSNTGLIILTTFFFIATSTIILIITTIINCNKVNDRLYSIEKMLQKKGYK